NTVGDNGFNVSLQFLNGAGGAITTAVAGEQITVSAVGTTAPGGCINGGTQYRFFKNGVLVQDWAQLPEFVDNPATDATYRVQVRCSLDPTCISTATSPAANLSIGIYTGDGMDIALSASHTSGTTTISWPSRFQPPLVSGYSLYSGTINSPGDPTLHTLSTIACLAATTP